MRKTLLILILLACLLSSIIIVSAEEPEWQVIDDSINGVYHGTSDNDNHEDKSKEIQPTPQPVLDLPFDRVFYIATLLICLIVMFPAKKTINQLCVNPHSNSFSC